MASIHEEETGTLALDGSLDEAVHRLDSIDQGRMFFRDSLSATGSGSSAGSCDSLRRWAATRGPMGHLSTRLPFIVTLGDAHFASRALSSARSLRSLSSVPFAFHSSAPGLGRPPTYASIREALDLVRLDLAGRPLSGEIVRSSASTTVVNVAGGRAERASEAVRHARERSEPERSEAL